MPLPLSSPHVHTQFCDGKSAAEDMARAAHALGFVSLGFSSHSSLAFDLVFAMSAEGEQAYIREVTRIRDEYAGRMKVWLGIEADSFSAFDRSAYEYTIGSVHYLACPDGYMLPVDAEAHLLADGIAKYYAGDGVAMAADYFANMGKYVREFRPDIIGHFDLVTKYNGDGSLFDTGDPRYRRAATDALDEAKAGCDLLEVNTGAMARIGSPAPYPEYRLLEYWRSIGGRVILSSDCHSAKDLTAGYELAESLVRRAGFREAWLLGTGEALFEAAAL